MSRPGARGLQLGLCAALAACSQPVTPPGAAALAPIQVGTAMAAEQTLSRTLDDYPRSLDPDLTTDIPSQRVLDDLFEGLVTLSIDGRPVPGAAASWQRSADSRTWTFHLRADARWSNGAPVTADDFVYSWRREVDPRTASGYAQALAPIVNGLDIALGRRPPETLGVEANDAHTLTVHLRHRRRICSICWTRSISIPCIVRPSSAMAMTGYGPSTSSATVPSRLPRT